LYAEPEGQLRLARKSGSFRAFDGTEVNVSAGGQDANGARIIRVSVSGPFGKFDLPLFAGEAAHLMFEIGHALEQAAAKARSH
jgi:hypothetical protein